MTQIRDARKHRQVMALTFWLSGLLWLSGELFFIGLPVSSFWFVLLQGLYMLGFLVFNAAFIVVMRRKFRCPECGGAVQDLPEGTEGDPVLKVCKHCDTIWRIGSV